MRIENWYGNYIVCGHIFPVNEIKPGQKWQSSSGDIVTIDSIDNLGWVKYSGEHQPTAEKESFAFQCRYCKICNEKE